MVEIDEATGLPVLPDGYFFRVKTGTFDIFPWVELRQKLWIFSVRIAGKWSASQFSSVEAKISWLAFRLWEDFEACRVEVEASIRLSGDYPPKKLEVRK